MTLPPRCDDRRIGSSHTPPSPPSTPLPPYAPLAAPKQVQPALDRELEKGKKAVGTPGASGIQKGDAHARMEAVRRAFLEINLSSFMFVPNLKGIPPEIAENGIK